MPFLLGIQIEKDNADIARREYYWPPYSHYPSPNEVRMKAQFSIQNFNKIFKNNSILHDSLCEKV